MLEIATIGAGGGSIGWIDAGGLLRMGPESAGALPGPVSYGRGGTRPTCTDTDVVLGYLDPAQFAGGKLPLDREAARAAIEAQIAAPLGLDVEEAAAGMYSVINANMAHGVREITVKRGVDPREFPMVVAGGAGALHASAIADELEIPTLIIPRTASTLCATGMLLSDLQHDFVRSCMGTLSDIDRDHLNLLAQEMMDEGEMHLKKEGAREIDHQISMDLRYLRQYHEVTVPIEPEDLRRGDIDRMAAALHGAHDQLYGYNLEEAGTPLELINIRVRSMGRGDGIELPRLDRGSSDAGHALRGSRRAWVFDRSRFEDVRIYDGQSLLAGNEIPGPALIERTDTTIFVSANFHAHVDDLGSVILNATEASDD
jgi:N-methylhydantoinase A